MKKIIPLLLLAILTACSKDQNTSTLEKGAFKIVIQKGQDSDKTSIRAVFISDPDSKIIINGKTENSFTEGIQLDQVSGTALTGQTDILTRTMTLGVNVRADGNFDTIVLPIQFFFNEELIHERSLSIVQDFTITDYLYSLDVQNNLELVEQKNVLD